MNRCRTLPNLRVSAAFFAACALTALSPAQAQSWPTKPVRVVEAGGVGGLSDILARAIAPPLSERFGQPFVVENRPGSNGVLGTDACAKGTPDGHTLCLLSNSYLSMNPYLYVKLPYDPQRDFTPIVNMSFVGGLIIASPSLPANNARELIELAKSKPGALNWATWGTGSFAHLTLALVENDTGARFNQVPYKAPAAAVTGVVAGEAQVTQNNPRVMLPLIKSGKLKPIAVVGPTRFKSILPDVATFAEQGYDLDFLRGDFGLLAPAGTPRTVVQQLNAEVNKLLVTPAFLEKYIAALGMDAAGGTPEDYAAFLKNDRNTAARVAKAANLKPE
jgi:tripartite-type tricarboxylate transporter receptor subunit TctC